VKKYPSHQPSSTGENLKRGEGEKEGEGGGLWAIAELGLRGNMSGG